MSRLNSRSVPHYAIKRLIESRILTTGIGQSHNSNNSSLHIRQCTILKQKYAHFCFFLFYTNCALCIVHCGTCDRCILNFCLRSAYFHIQIYICIYIYIFPPINLIFDIHQMECICYYEKIYVIQITVSHLKLKMVHVLCYAIAQKTVFIRITVQTYI